MKKRRVSKAVKNIGDFDDEPGREGGEGEEDLDAVDVDTIHETVVAASDWTTQTILSQLDQGNIDINPAFQRRDAWRPPRSPAINMMWLRSVLRSHVAVATPGIRGKDTLLRGEVVTILPQPANGFGLSILSWDKLFFNVLESPTLAPGGPPQMDVASARNTRQIIKATQQIKFH
jgi:hypothetical protein